MTQSGQSATAARGRVRALLGQVAPQDYLAIWVSGYYYGKNNNTIIEVQQLKENMNDFKRDCLYSKGNLMQAVEKVLSQGK